MEHTHNALVQISFSYIHSNPCRIDKYISDISSQLNIELSRSQLEKYIQEILINKKSAKRSHQLEKKDFVEITLLIKETFAQEPIVSTQDSTLFHTLDILYQDECILAINKARGMVVHPGAGHREKTLSQIVATQLSSYREEDLLNNRAGIVHRLDKDTSGVIIIAKTARTHEKLSKLFSRREIQKKYIAIVVKEPRQRIHSLDGYIARDTKHRKKFKLVQNEQKGKYAHTDYRVVYSTGEYSIVVCEPHTGRTHQIRVHMQSMGNPIVGDSIYGRSKTLYRDLLRDISSAGEKDIDKECSLMLHSYEINFSLALHGEVRAYNICAPIPDDMHQAFACMDAPQEIENMLLATKNGERNE